MACHAQLVASPAPVELGAVEILESEALERVREEKRMVLLQNYTQ